ncbi:MAG: glycosyltransferase family 2 protein [Methyloprofundus sp.]|nr:glycosyltransferase family 2 protein [Methyloprofundus sp.]
MKASAEIANVSVVIPCYRCADTIVRAVKSVAAQTLKPYEVILVEDCSGDNTLEALYQLQSQYEKEWIKVIALKENSGPGTARNIGWDASEQDYIAFLDADDSWHPQKVEIQYGWMVKNQGVILTGHDFILNANKNNYLEGLNVDFKKVNKWRLLFSNKFFTSSVMLKNNVTVRFPAGRKYCEDYYLWAEIAFANLKCYRVNLPLVILHKPAYGVSGLSANLWAMEKGELDVYRALYSKKLISGFQYLFFSFFSLIKYLKRVVS